MTLSLYSIHQSALQTLQDSDNSVREGGIGAIGYGILDHLFARVICLSSIAEIIEPLLKWPIYIVRIGFVFSDGSWSNSFARSIAAIALIACKTLCKFLLVVGSILAPEICLQWLRMHHLSLFLGLLLRAEFQTNLPTSAHVSVILDQHIRINSASRAYRDCLQYGNNPIDQFFPMIWVTSIISTVFSELGVRLTRQESGLSLEFQRQLIQTITEKNRWLLQHNIYTVEEIESMSATVLIASLNITIFHLLNMQIKKNDSGAIIIDNTLLTAENGGSLFEQYQLLSTLVDQYNHLSSEQRESMVWHLLVDEDLAKSVNPTLTPMDQETHQLFLSIGQFRTSYIEHHLQENPQQLLEAFSIN